MANMQKRKTCLISLKPFTPDRAFWRGFTTTHFEQQSGKPRESQSHDLGNPNHMTSDIATDIEAC